MEYPDKCKTKKAVPKVKELTGKARSNVGAIPLKIHLMPPDCIVLLVNGTNFVQIFKLLLAWIRVLIVSKG